MVQILPPPTSLGAEVGHSLGQGIQKGAEQGFQRSQVQQALKGLGNLPSNATPFDLAKELISATAGIPGAERYVGQLFPLLLQQMQSQKAFQNEQGSGDQTPQSSNQHAGSPQGWLWKEINPQEIDDLAKQYAQQTGTGLEGYEQKRQQLLGKNAIAGQRREQIRSKFAENHPDPEDQNIFMLGLEDPEIGKINDIEKVLQKGTKSFETKKAVRDSIKNLDPFTRWGGLRQIQEMIPTVQRAVKELGEERVRKELQNKDLSLPDIEGLIYPVTSAMKSPIKNLPYFRVGTSFKADKWLDDYFDKNLSSVMPLSTIARELSDKGIASNKIVKSMNKYVDRMTERQKSDLDLIANERHLRPGIYEIFGIRPSHLEEE